MEKDVKMVLYLEKLGKYVTDVEKSFQKKSMMV
jgi:hypothetical protein